jgi:hypothetical protein
MLSIVKKIKWKSAGKSRLGVFTIAALLALIGITAIAEANNIRWYISPSDPYIQNWSDTTAINIDDNWDNFIAINGYRGDDLTTGIGVDPQTVLADGAGTPLDVIANQSNPNTLTTGGVAEFDGIANPTIALKGSATADAPNLVIALNKQSCPDSKFISIGYKVRDLDSTSNNAVQQVALHYRVGTTGNYINVPGAFVADATDPNAATKVTNVVGMLPHIPLGTDEIYLRIMTTNAAGNDEWVGIDDINIGCFVVTSATAEVSGRVLTGKSGGISKAIVSMVDQEGLTHTARTNTFGYYKFDNVVTGKFYTLSVIAKGYQFEPRVVAVSDAIGDLDFYAQE